jgi:pilus assembly protein Flp/PilA
MIQHMKSFAQRLSRDEDGVTMLEYTILIGIITAAVIGSVAVAGAWVTTKWTALTAVLT